MALETTEDRAPNPDQRRLLRISAALGFLAVALGAFGAHGLEKVIDDPHRLEVWDTAVFYHLIHAVMLYLIAISSQLRRVAWNCIGLGIVIFSGSLYTLVLTGIGWLGAITPIGGLLFLVGWGLLVVRPAR